MPFDEYDDFEDCVRKNKDKEDPEAYCAKIQREIEGSDNITDKKDVTVSAAMSIKQIIASDTDDNTFTFAAAKVGSKSFGSDGTKFVFTKESLIAYAASWVDGIITLNHVVTDTGKIVAAWFDEATDLVMMTVEATNDDTAQRIRDGEPTGVSIEASIIDVDDDNNVLAFDGTGIGIIFYPEQPACPATDGCGILSTNHPKTTSSEYDSTNVDDSDNLVTTDDTSKNSTVGGVKMGDEAIETVPKSDYEAIVAKTVEMQSQIDAFKTDEAIKTRDADITAKDAEIVDLKAEINRRDTEIAASLIEEIKAWDVEFVPEDGLKLETIQTIHASLKRIAAKDAEAKASEQEEAGEEVKAGQFTAPDAARRTGGLTIGGMKNGAWTTE